MENLSRDLLVGATGSIIGAAIVTLFAFGWKWLTQSRAAAEVAWQEEIRLWKTGGLLGRQQMTNVYLFGILTYFIVGTIVVTVASVVGELVRLIPAILNACGLIFFYAALGKLLRYSRLQRHTPDHRVLRQSETETDINVG